MSELRTKIAAAVTILAIGGLGALALSHPQAPPRPAAASAQVRHVGSSATLVKHTGFENEGADD
jgi:hypothetical protein